MCSGHPLYEALPLSKYLIALLNLNPISHFTDENTEFQKEHRAHKGLSDGRSGSNLSSAAA